MTKKKLFQILLPLYNQQGESIPFQNYKDLRTELTENFGGLTTYSRSPATGVWKDPDDDLAVDQIIVYEVIGEELNLKYWQNLKIVLEKKFDQEEIMIRCIDLEVI